MGALARRPGAQLPVLDQSITNGRQLLLLLPGEPYRRSIGTAVIQQILQHFPHRPGRRPGPQSRIGRHGVQSGVGRTLFCRRVEQCLGRIPPHQIEVNVQTHFDVIQHILQRLFHIRSGHFLTQQQLGHMAIKEVGGAFPLHGQASPADTGGRLGQHQCRTVPLPAALALLSGGDSHQNPSLSVRVHPHRPHQIHALDFPGVGQKGQLAAAAEENHHSGHQGGHSCLSHLCFLRLGVLSQRGRSFSRGSGGRTTARAAPLIPALPEKGVK